MKQIGIVYNQAIHAFYEAGCRYLQLDECILSALHDPKLVRKSWKMLVVCQLMN